MTRPLYGRLIWSRVRRILGTPDRLVLVGLDLDGTLAPIVALPEMARVPALMLRALARASRAPGVRIAVLSARPLSDVRRLVPVPGLLLTGQYGLEGPTGPKAAIRAAYRRTGARLAHALMPIVEAAPGARLERKGMTLGVHDREVHASRLRRLREALASVAAGEAKRGGFVSVRGRRVTDFVPRGFDKGRVIASLRTRLTSDVVFYFGDSPGDEPAFAALHRPDFPVRVGPGRTRARYRVAGIAGVIRFLSAVAALRAGAA